MNINNENPKIAVIPGTGTMGAGIAKLAAKAGYTTYVSSRTIEKANNIVNQTKVEIPNADIIATEHLQAAKLADVIFWTIQGPLEDRHKILSTLKDVTIGKVMIDVTNIMYLYDEKAWGQVSSIEQNMEILPKCHWTTAFKSIFAQILLEPVTNGIPRDIQICGDNTDAKTITKNIVNKMGYRGIDLGGSKNGRLVEVLGPRWIMEVNSNTPQGQFGSWSLFIALMPIYYKQGLNNLNLSFLIDLGIRLIKPYTPAQVGRPPRPRHVMRIVMFVPIFLLVLFVTSAEHRFGPWYFKKDLKTPPSSYIRSEYWDTQPDDQS